MMPKESFDSSWLQWIKENRELGADITDLAHLLLKHDFSPTLINKTLGLSIKGEFLPALSDIPQLTPQGFTRLKTPEELWVALRACLTGITPVPEVVEKFITAAPGQTPSELHPLSDTLKGFIHARLQLDIESWIGRQVAPTYVYGIRTYHDTATLRMHRDRSLTHVASVIINVDQQQIRKPWPLHIQDHAGNDHLIYLEPGDMLFYEGARLLHGRPDPLEGESFSNVFVHYKLI